MSDDSLTSPLIAFAAAFMAGAINSVAGGGTLISFPALLALGLPPVIANATNTVGIWPGSFGSMWGFRRELRAMDRRLLWFLIPAFLGSLAGAWLLRVLPPHLFERAVPWLLLFATGLFAVQGTVQKLVGTNSESVRMGRYWLSAALLLQFGVAVYGGYFGAGMSIMALSILGLLGMSDMFQMTAVTSLLGFVINGTAGVCFVFAGLVHWPCALSMTVGSLAGGYGAAGLARKIGRAALKKFVLCVGLVLSLTLFLKALR